MFKVLFSIILALAFTGCTQNTNNKKRITKKLASVARPDGLPEQPSEVSNTPYCAAIRGNGELVPSHWSALSRIVENLGMPEAMSGGSSATITMFYMESIASNPLITSEDNTAFKRRKQALLLKTIPLYKKALAEYENINNSYKIFTELKNSSSKVSSGLQAAFTAAKNRKAIEEAVKKYGYVYNPEFIRNLRQNFRFTQQEMQNAFAVFGSFDAVKDKNLFFRPGLIDFKYVALLIGQIGDFYAGNVSQSVMNRMNNFLNECSISAYGNLWPGENDKDCQDLFISAAIENFKDKYNSQNITKSKQLFKKIGTSITSYPTTSLIVSDAQSAYISKLKDYKNGNIEGIENFSVKAEEIKFGYWSSSKEQLKKTEMKLRESFSEDLKSQKFLSLGTGNWFEVLASSPAEPGLANFQKIMTDTNPTNVHEELFKGHNERWDGLNYKDNMISAGGWSDLEPTLILRAHGCENIVFVTRTDGPSLFSQQVFIRLAGLTKKIPFWNKIGEHNKEGWDLSGENSTARDTDWYKMYSVNNPESSHNISVKEADANYCTNWNAFNVFKSGDLDKLWYDAYNSPVYLKNGAPSVLKVTEEDADIPLVGCI